jgi:hypothetical protein
VRLLRHVLAPEAVGLVDVELLLGLGRGLTGWLTPVVAMRQTLYNFLLVIETLGWVRPGWLEAARAFPDDGQDEALSPHGTRSSVTQRGTSTPPSHTISLFPDPVAPTRQKEHPGMTPRDSMLPTFNISDRTKGLMAWLAVDAGISLDEVVDVLVEDYRMRQGDGLDFEDLQAVVRLREACETTEIAVSDLRIAVELTAGLRERGLTVDHIQTTLQVAEDLAEAGLSLKEAVAVAGLIKAMRKAGVDPRLPEYLGAALQRYGVLGYDPKQITRLAELWERLRGLGLGLDDLEPVLARLSGLTALGLDVETAEALATGLDLAGIPEALRGDVLTKAVQLGQAGVALAEVQADRETCQGEAQQLRDEQAAIQDALAVDQDALTGMQQEQDEARTALAALREQAVLYTDAIAAGMALQDFLLGNLDAADVFFTRVVAIREIRRTGSALFPGIETTLTEAIQRGVREFLARISTLPLRPSPPSAQGTATKG